MQSNIKGTTYQKYLMDIVSLYKSRQDIRNYLELLLSIVAVGIFVVFAIKPTLTTIGDLITKINAEQKTSDDLDIKIKNLGTAQTLYNANQDKITLLNLAIPDNPDVAGLVRQLEGVTKKDNLTTLSVTVDPVDVINATTSAQSITATNIVSGDYPSIDNFIKDIENIRRPGVLTKLDVVLSGQTLNTTTTTKFPFSK